MNNVQVEGLRDLLEGLARTEKDMNRAANRANLAGVKVVAEELKKQVPVSKNGIYNYSNDGHMKDKIVTSNNKKNKNTGESYAEAGFSKGTAWRVHFPFGTIKQAPNPYFDRTIANSSSRVNRAMADEIRKILT